MKHLSFKRTTKYYISGCVLVALSYFAIFHNIGKEPIKMWDEATYANNAIDMLTNKNYITVMDGSKPDLYNTKPPFVIWLQALAMNLFGINEFSVRLPSAIFGFLTIMLTFLFSLKVLKNWFIGLIAALILLSSSGYIGYHIVRTGDLDSSLTFWLTLYVFAFIATLIDKKYQKNLVYLLISLSICFAFLTKGVAAFLFLPPLFILSLLYKNYHLYTHKRVYYSLLVIFLFCSSYYLLREWDNPGYLKIVWENEISRINKVVMEWQVKPYDFYLINLIETRFYPYSYLVPLAIVTFIFKNKNAIPFKSTLYLLLVSCGYLLIISYPSVKLSWYDAPLFPLLSLLVAINMNTIIDVIKVKTNLIKSILVVLLLFNVCITINNNTSPKGKIYTMEREGAFLKEIVAIYPNLENITIFKKEDHPEHYDQVLFYKKAFLLEKNILVELKQSPVFKTSELVIVCKNELKTILKDTYNTEGIYETEVGGLYRIIDEIKE